MTNRGHHHGWGAQEIFLPRGKKNLDPLNLPLVSSKWTSHFKLHRVSKLCTYFIGETACITSNIRAANLPDEEILVQVFARTKTYCDLKVEVKQPTYWRCWEPKMVVSFNIWKTHNFLISMWKARDFSNRTKKNLSYLHGPIEKHKQ